MYRQDMAPNLMASNGVDGSALQFQLAHSGSGRAESVHSMSEPWSITDWYDGIANNPSYFFHEELDVQQDQSESEYDPESEVTFIKAKTFIGAKLGYVFTTGDRGAG